ncbi:MAG: hypothetical protein H6713_35025 [Myxococcales bacterium]|nr:hypothetical protein [Myxococcales bacterium]MCB9755181.1 hypothetical protein [Myxococcales bacterium]
MSVFAGLLAALLSAAPAQAPTQAPTSAAGGVPSPLEHLGRPVGTNFELADYAEVIAYSERLAAARPNAPLETAGQTTEGRALR